MTRREFTRAAAVARGHDPEKHLLEWQKNVAMSGMLLEDFNKFLDGEMTAMDCFHIARVLATPPEEVKRIRAAIAKKHWAERKTN